MAEYTNYAQFNSITVTGRISNAEIVTRDGSEFLSVTVISTLVKDGKAVNFTFTNSNGLLSLFKKDGLPKGREITFTGHIKDVTEVYFDKKLGQTKLLSRPRISLDGVMIPDGGLGRMPKSERQAVTAGGSVVTTDKAPSFGKEGTVTDNVF